jgi:cell division protein FtsQ
MRFINGMTVRLPEDTALEPAIARLAKLQVRTALTQRPIQTIDLRSSGGRVYLRLADAPAPAASPSESREAAERT